ncbi:MAG: alpha-ribazole phosphatase [Rhodobacteraceae bacterium HLUCCA12]|nr:MAG: alpha-ribazole phosphatase [Rhodobacteraceae bacterium HLUCCA12]
MALILLRHTRPHGADGLCYGRTDLPLAGDFTTEAARLASDLPPFQRILTSPLGRCRRLAESLAAARGRPLAVDARLAEMDFGSWEGVRWDAIARHELDAWAADLTGARPHGGETVAELAARSHAALTDAERGAVPALVVCHAGIIKAALSAAQGAAGWRAETDYGSWLRLDSGWNRSVAGHDHD